MKLVLTENNGKELLEFDSTVIPRIGEIMTASFDGRVTEYEVVKVNHSVNTADGSISAVYLTLKPT